MSKFTGFGKEKTLGPWLITFCIGLRKRSRILVNCVAYYVMQPVAARRVAAKLVRMDRLQVQ